MSYPLDLDEIDEAKLRAELTRRGELRASGRCDYCGRPSPERPCRFPLRHRGKLDPLRPCNTPDCRNPGVEESAHGGYWCAVCWRRVTTEGKP